jgi:hypothetical protein
MPWKELPPDGHNPTEVGFLDSKYETDLAEPDE